MKTAATLNGDVIPYFAAYRALNTESIAVASHGMKGWGFNFLFLTWSKWKLYTLDHAAIGYVQNEDATMKEFDVFPSFVNDSLQFVRLVISLDAAYASNEE